MKNAIFTPACTSVISEHRKHDKSIRCGRKHLPSRALVDGLASSSLYWRTQEAAESSSRGSSADGALRAFLSSGLNSGACHGIQFEKSTAFRLYVKLCVGQQQRLMNAVLAPGKLDTTCHSTALQECSLIFMIGLNCQREPCFAHHAIKRACSHLLYLIVYMLKLLGSSLMLAVFIRPSSGLPSCGQPTAAELLWPLQPARRCARFGRPGRWEIAALLQAEVADAWHVFFSPC